MRLFTAFDVPEDLRGAYARVEDLARAWKRDEADGEGFDARWQPPEQYHCTLRFIGEVGDETAQSYRAALQEVARSTFECEPYGLDVLPGRRNPRVLIAGLHLSDPLKRLYEEVSEVLESRGLDPEDRSYKPHVTLARFNDAPRESVHAFLRAHDDLSLPSFSVSEFHLFESTLTPDGAVHDIRDTYPLRRDD